MDDEELDTKLRCVGKKVFVKHFYTFKDFTEGVISLEDITEIFMLDGTSTEGGTFHRCRNAQIIFDNDSECEALTLLAKSKNLPEETIDLAEKILLEHCLWSESS